MIKNIFHILLWYDKFLEFHKSNLNELRKLKKQTDSDLLQNLNGFCYYSSSFHFSRA